MCPSPPSPAGAHRITYLLLTSGLGPQRGAASSAMTAPAMPSATTAAAPPASLSSEQVSVGHTNGAGAADPATADSAAASDPAARDGKPAASTGSVSLAATVAVSSPVSTAEVLELEAAAAALQQQLQEELGTVAAVTLRASYGAPAFTSGSSGPAVGPIMLLPLQRCADVEAALSRVGLTADQVQFGGLQ